MTFEEILLQRYGPIISISQLASVLDRSAEGLRVSLRSKSKFALRVNAARLKIGQRVYFRTIEVAEIMAGGESDTDESDSAALQVGAHDVRGKIESLVWERYPTGGGELLIALVFARQARDDGTGIQIRIAKIAKQTRQSGRTVHRYVTNMRASGWLLPVRLAGGRGIANEYRIDPLWICGGVG